MAIRTFAACDLCNCNCWACEYMAQCEGYWKKDASASIYTITTERHVKMSLCAGRHEIPDATDGAIFEEIEDPTDAGEIEYQAGRRIAELQIASMDLYVTGLSVALVAVINVCHTYGIELYLWHYDRNTGKYFYQPVA